MATTDVVLDARSLEAPVDLDGAGPQGEQLACQAEGLPHGGRRVVGPVVGGAVAGHAAGHQESREGFVGGQLEERIVLVVAQDDVVARPMPADQGGLQHQRLELVVGHDVLEVADLPDEGVRLRIAWACLLEIGADSRAQRGGLAHVDHLDLGILEEIDAWSLRKALELGVQRFAHSWRRRKARTRSRSSAACSKSNRRAASFIRVSSSSMCLDSSSAERAGSGVSGTSTV